MASRRLNVLTFSSWNMTALFAWSSESAYTSVGLSLPSPPSVDRNRGESHDVSIAPSVGSMLPMISVGHWPSSTLVWALV